MDKLTKIPKCPESIQTAYSPLARCNLNDKICTLESGYKCPYYQELLEEQKEENA